MSYPHFPRGKTTLPPKRETVLCPRCINESVWVDHGPMVGRGYYCRHCGKDVDHPDNVFGLSGSQIEAAKKKAATSDPGFLYTQLHCSKPNCKFNKPGILGAGSYIHIADAQSIQPLKVGQIVCCEVDHGVTQHLKRHEHYKIVEVLAHTIRIEVPVRSGPFGGVENREYTRCRFTLVHKK